jgi:uncharacterized RDD family membrane protein YckC
MQRFDEIELEMVPLGGATADVDAADGPRSSRPAPVLDAILRGSPSLAAAETAMANHEVTFGEIAAAALPLPDDDEQSREALSFPSTPAPLSKRLLALLTDLSLFAALTMALSPLLPATRPWMSMAALAGFLVMVSYYYFVCCWLFWGKTVSGAIFDVRVVPDGAAAMSIRDASLRWCGVYLSLALGGLGFLMAALPSRRSLPDRLSNTRCVAG